MRKLDPRRITFDPQSAENMMLHELLQKIRDLCVQFKNHFTSMYRSENKTESRESYMLMH